MYSTAGSRSARPSRTLGSSWPLDEARFAPSVRAAETLGGIASLRTGGARLPSACEKAADPYPGRTSATRLRRRMKLPSKKSGRTMRLVASAIAVSGVAGCFTLGEGLEPPATELYYPTAILTSPGHHTLYVVNSDFDIQYTGGTVQAIALDNVRACVSRLADNLSGGMSAKEACSDIGLGTSANEVLVPGPCDPIDLEANVACTLTDDPTTTTVEGPVAGPLLRTSRVIGAFASSATLLHNPSVDTTAGDSAERLLVAVRGDPSVTYFETTDDATDTTSNPYRLDCQQDETADIGGICPKAARVGASPYQSTRLISMPTEPNGIAASDDGGSIVTVHQTGGTNSATRGQASLLVNSWGTAPTLEFTLAGLPDFPTDVAAIPTSEFVRRKKAAGAALDYRPGFLVTFRAAAEVDLLRYFDDSAGTSRSFLQRVGAFAIATNSDGSDSRGIAIDASDRKKCESACDDGDLDCYEACVAVPLHVFVANRAPASLLVGRLETHLEVSNGEITSLTETVNLSDMVPLATGPSRVAVGNVLDAEGKASPRAFVISFDSRYVVIYDPAQRRVEAAIRTGRGPHALAFDTIPKSANYEGSAFLYVAHFTDSYIGVVDLDQRHSGTYGSMFAAVGVPKPPKESQ